jgi:hypothetical protein
MKAQSPNQMQRLERPESTQQQYMDSTFQTLVVVAFQAVTSIIKTSVREDTDRDVATVWKCRFVWQ